MSTPLELAKAVREKFGIGLHDAGKIVAAYAAEPDKGLLFAVCLTEANRFAIAVGTGLPEAERVAARVRWNRDHAASAAADMLRRDPSLAEFDRTPPPTLPDPAGANPRRTLSPAPEGIHVEIVVRPDGRPDPNLPPEAYGRCFTWVAYPAGQDEETLGACAVHAYAQAFDLDPYCLVRDNAIETKTRTKRSIDSEFPPNRKGPYRLAEVDARTPAIAAIVEMLREREQEAAPKGP